MPDTYDDRELTDAELERQDIVDSAIFTMVRDLMKNGKKLQWDIEWIGEIRDSVQYLIVEVLNDQTEMEFYPYIEWTMKEEE